MDPYGYPILMALLLWWFSTGVIIFLDGMSSRTYPLSMAAASALAVAALFGIAWSGTQDSVAAAYCGFGCALLVWGWNEMAFLMGFLTGPSKEPCPHGQPIGQRFKSSFLALAYHEAALLMSGAAILLSSPDGAGSLAFKTYLLLFLMRLSTKLNIFLGVPNVAVEFLPPHLQYLKSYFAVRSMNLLFPVSITAGTLVCGALIWQAAAPTTSPSQSIGATLLATLAVLGIVEHWFLVLPISINSLWGWGLASHKQTEIQEREQRAARASGGA